MAENLLGIGTYVFADKKDVELSNELEAFSRNVRDNIEYLLRPSIVSVTEAYTATDLDYTILGDASSGDFSVTLPQASTVEGLILAIKNIGASGTVTIDGYLSETIDGTTTEVLSTQYQSSLLHCNGTSWFKISTT